MSIAWDAFRVIDNNSSSVMFVRCDENPESVERRRYDAAVKNSSITLENIRMKLTYRYYKNVDEFVSDMETLFENWIQFNGERHRQYITCVNMRNRFRKFIEKNRPRLNEDRKKVISKSSSETGEGQEEE